MQHWWGAVTKNSFSLWDNRAVESPNPRIIKAALCLICSHSRGLTWIFCVLETFAHIHPPPPLAEENPKSARSREDDPMCWIPNICVVSKQEHQNPRQYPVISRALETSRGQTHWIPSGDVFVLGIKCIYLPIISYYYYYSRVINNYYILLIFHNYITLLYYIPWWHKGGFCSYSDDQANNILNIYPLTPFSLSSITVLFGLLHFWSGVWQSEIISVHIRFGFFIILVF